MTPTRTSRIRRVLSDAEGSSTAEWALSAALLTMLFLTIVQVAFALHVRTTLVDAAGEGARHAGTVGASLAAGEERTATLIGLALSSGYARDVRAEHVSVDGVDVVRVTVTAPLPLIGLVGLPDSLTVVGRAPVERLGR